MKFFLIIIFITSTSYVQSQTFMTIRFESDNHSNDFLTRGNLPESYRSSINSELNNKFVNKSYNALVNSKKRNLLEKKYFNSEGDFPDGVDFFVVPYVSFNTIDKKYEIKIGFYTFCNGDIKEIKSIILDNKLLNDWQRNGTTDLEKAIRTEVDADKIIELLKKTCPPKKDGINRLKERIYNQYNNSSKVPNNTNKAPNSSNIFENKLDNLLNNKDNLEDKEWLERVECFIIENRKVLEQNLGEEIVKDMMLKIKKIQNKYVIDKYKN